jgi:hypothetical protein
MAKEACLMVDAECNLRSKSGVHSGIKLTTMKYIYGLQCGRYHILGNILASLTVWDCEISRVREHHDQKLEVLHNMILQFRESMLLNAD